MTDKTEETRPSTPPRRRFRRRRWVWCAIAGLTAFWLVVGPWPLRRDHYAGSSYEQATLERLDRLSLSFPSGPLHAGVGAVEITPAVGEPLAGFSAREPMAAEGAMEPLHAKAITLSNGERTVTLLGGDILLVLPDLRRRILQVLELPARDIYFTASHTHSGPGGFAPGRIEQISFGSFDESIADRLAGQFAEAVRASRAGLRPVSLGFARPQPDPAVVANRVVEAGPVDNTLSCVLLRSADGEVMAGLVSYAAHPTCFGRRNRKACGDYPGLLQRELEQQLGGRWLFVAGAVGSMKPASDQPRGPRRREQVAGRLTRCAVQAVREQMIVPPSPVGEWVPIEAAILPVDLPPMQIRVARHLRLSPVVTALLDHRQSFIHLLTVGDLLLLAQPCDYSGEFSNALVKRSAGTSRPAGAASRFTVVTTSFNGSYIGYLLPADRYDLDHYETRTMSFYGPWCGEYFQSLSRELVSRAERALGAPAAEAISPGPSGTAKGPTTIDPAVPGR